jgi:hypothetical protein
MTVPSALNRGMCFTRRTNIERPAISIRMEKEKIEIGCVVRGIHYNKFTAH